MSPQQLREEEIFAAAFELPLEQRAAYLAEACAGNPELLAHIEGLLGALDRASPLLKQPPPSLLAQKTDALTAKPGDKIGRYKLLEQIGEGGCGIVYVAEQEEPMRRRVALKIIKLGMDTKQIIARFDAERQALAMMDHPNIAKIHDAGATDTGRPFFVMELVRGIKITDYCEEHQLSPRERLDLFIQVCRAIQHAHQKGIIHRDIKPSNILVTSGDGVPVPKVIDFGIAKATEGRLTDQTIYTAFEQFIGTPAYMSPEQAQLSMQDIDTRSDIYSLGVLLYELLTGTTPFDTKELLARGLDQMRRTICEVEPLKPSTRLTQERQKVQGKKGEKRAKGGYDRSEPSLSTLSSQFSTDLDWIVMKCLEKDRTRRYDTANGLATDIQLHLNNEPIVARPPSRLYRFQKSVQRNKLMFAGFVVVATALLGGICVTSWALLRERAARRQAETAGVFAKTESERSKEIAKFLTDTLRAAGPSVTRGRDATVLREMLDQAVKRVGKELQNQPQLQGDLWLTLGHTYADIGDFQHAITSFESAVASYRAAFGDENCHLALALGELGRLQSWTCNVTLGQTNAQSGLHMARKCGDPETLATCLFNVGASFECYGQGTLESIPYLREALELRKRQGNTPDALADCMRALANAFVDSDSNSLPEAESLSREVLALRRQYLEPDHPKIADALFLLGQALLKNGKFEEAEVVLRETDDLFRKLYGANHPRQFLVLRYLAQALVARSKWTEAEAAVGRGLEVSAANSNYQHIFGALDCLQGNWQRATEHLERAAGPFPDIDGCDALENLVFALLESGRYDECHQHCHEMLQFFADFNPAVAIFHNKSAVAFRNSVVANAVLLLSRPGADFDKACEIANDTRWTIIPKALAELRCKRFESARDWADRAAQSEYRRLGRAAAWFIKSSAYARLQKLELAQAAFAQGDELFKDPRNLAFLDFWDFRQWVVSDLLRREVKTLLDSQLNAVKDEKSQSH